MKDRIRVYCISYKFAPVMGGAEGRAERHARQLQALGHDVIVITLRLHRSWRRRESLDGLPVVRVGGKYRRDGQLHLGKFGHLFIAIGVLLFLWRERHRYDLIHAFQLAPPSVVAALLSHITRKPIIVSIQNAGPDENQLARFQSREGDPPVNAYGLQVDAKEDLAMRGSDVTGLPQVMPGGRIFLSLMRRSHAHYQVLSTRCHSSLASKGFPVERIVAIPGCVNTELFRVAREESPDPAGAARNIICVARLEYAKGIDVLLHAWAQMMHAPPVWLGGLRPALHLVGDGKFRAQLERIAAELGIADSVKFLGQRGDVVTLLQQSWGFVLPSRWEGMPNALLEAMACGLPCVATRVSGSEDVIAHGVNGFLVNPERPTELARALRRIVENTDLARRLGNEARSTVVRDYQLGSVADRCVELYRRLLAGGRAPEFETGRSADASLHNSIGTEERSGT